MSNAHAQHSPDSALRVMISGGGTGGHIFPAIAIANAVREREATTQFLFVGAEGKMEMEKVPAAGYAIEGLPIRGFKRGSIMGNIGLPLRILRSMLKARRLVKSFKPHVAVGVGGYASGPLLAAAQRMAVPTLIQEQNSFPGKTNVYLAKRVDRICVAYAGMDKYFPKEKLLITGNPVRQDVVRLTGKRPRGLEHFNLQDGRPILFVTGGSLGARGVNRGIEMALPMFKEAGLQVIWQTGKPFLEQAQAAVDSLGYTDCKVMQFVDRMDYAYAAADLVVARAGAISVSELSLVQKPAILIPLPTAAEDHQTHNARMLTDQGAAVLVRDADAVAELGRTVVGLITDRPALDKLQHAIASLGTNNSAETIAAEVIRLAKRPSTRNTTRP
ncbi:MAG: undecaprenyldiphospho-muramoylpentapeptide beta-N-acetylglucosaminyltransferase [Flavobacteriales bacterium]|nr:undecaprenyldiphospho-muramoylpentapeptide beta-N-acetylglucosaminyltransferase [Flavobacteriales bacterium]MBP7156369.1 undecaprenyldiphospho-muramoylpentapeptide beta-N-acetylglucosaminyltransferase [Flavobacteriales bacterium]HQW40869.1 undecaprenyldiphospho-muramoylpentapeptide beta-N-acetylglucosaminyltransferase [Flavobacteriales bacterium]